VNEAGSSICDKAGSAEPPQDLPQWFEHRLAKSRHSLSPVVASFQITLDGDTVRFPDQQCFRARRHWVQHNCVLHV
jgi:hypothetical protein